MKTFDEKEIKFPIGYHLFHKKQIFNFQLNRWYSIGFARYKDMKEVGQKINNFADWRVEMIRLAEKAISEERFVNAAIYYRSAEFYIINEDSENEDLYKKYCDLFYQATKDENLERILVPYGNSYLPVLKVPGQGAALKTYGVPLDIEWEKPTKAVLDHFNLNNVTLWGLSMGGWYCLRAGAFEHRIKRIIAAGHSIDYMKSMPKVLYYIHMLFLKKFRKLTNKMSLKSLKKGKGLEAWMMGNLMYITKKALINARSVTDIVFTKESQAQNHCQIGNIGLVLDTMINWLEEKRATDSKI